MVTLLGSIVSLEHQSEVLKNNAPGDPYERTLPIYLPPGYDDQPDQRYPVIWVLAPFGSWGERFFNLQAWDENIVQRMDRLIGEGKAKPAILAFPDCFTSFGGSQYVNSPAVGNYKDYILEELIPLVDDTFRTTGERDRRGVLGYSSGGYGALMLAMEHPDIFGAAASHSGDMYFEQGYWMDFSDAVRELERAGGVSAFLASLKEMERPQEKSRDWSNTLNIVAMSACYSPNTNSPYGFDLPFDLYTGMIKEDVWKRWQEKDLIRIVEDHLDALRSMRSIYFDCGIRDEYNLFLGARRLHQILDQHGIEHTYFEHEGGHRNINWRYEYSLPIITQALWN
jgi:enterochelin esterase-like enzyme